MSSMIFNIYIYIYIYNAASDLQYKNATLDIA